LESKVIAAIEPEDAPANATHTPSLLLAKIEGLHAAGLSAEAAGFGCVELLEPTAKVRYPTNIAPQIDLDGRR